jgi:C4-dicarboxylate-specific signal transduction histidine kinase
LKHIVQNAVESVTKNGWVNIELTSKNSANISIIITDNGNGMSAEFIATRLFRPFDSTKGVSGMGIGVYQCREYIRSINGNIQVTSIENAGTTFTITLPTNTNNK